MIYTKYKYCYNIFMNENYLKEKANSLRNEMSHLWTAMFITGGGAIGFTIFEDKNALIIFYITVGIVLAIMCYNAYIIRRNQLLNIIKYLRTKGEQNGENI